ncbi:MAG: hypothetical protein JWN64_753 [Parcubacteria group bacterium]|nr:hypothetical protein [Parcubacteria group bacterium]
MRLNLLAVLATTAILALPGGALAQAVAPPVIPVVVMPSDAHITHTPGYYRFDTTHFMVVRWNGGLLSKVEDEYVSGIFEKCDSQFLAPGPNPGHDRPIDFSALLSGFRTCVRTSLDGARRQNILPGDYDYVVMEAPLFRR